MSLCSDKIPFSNQIGLKIKIGQEHEINEQKFLNYFSNMKSFGVDYLVSDFSVQNMKLKQNFNTLGLPCYIDDFILYPNQWSSFFVSYVDLPNDILKEDAKNSLLQDYSYSSYLGSKSFILNFKFSHKIEEDLFILKDLMSISKEGSSINLTVDFETKENFDYINEIIKELNYPLNLGIVLKLNKFEDKKDDEIALLISKWISLNIKAIYLDKSLFLINNNGYPVLPKKMQAIIKTLMRYKIDVIFDLDEEEEIQKINNYVVYIQHLFENHYEYNNTDFLLTSYLDMFQTPLQPLRDNLPSYTYYCFEEVLFV